MKFSVKDLEKIFDCDFEPYELEDQLTRIGLEVDAIETLTPPFSQVIACKVLDVSPHPNADRLVVAQVDTGDKKLQIVCGAANCKPGLLTALALIGAALTDSKGKKQTLKKGNLRGVESHGMLLSKEELGLEEKSDGIIELDDSFQPGDPLAPLFTDTLLDISFTPNLGHAMSLLGITRELSCLLNKDYTFSSLDLPPHPSLNEILTIEVDGDCPKFEGLILKGLTVKSSPLWLQQKLKHLGFQSINNIVDVTNYVLHELGHPLHAYDLNDVSLDSLSVKKNHQITSFTALDGKNYEVPAEALFVSDAKGPLSLAGIIGGSESQVKESTHSILLEAAVFNPSTVRKTSRKMGLSTEASKHFERGVDFKGPEKALKRAASMILGLAGGTLENKKIHFEKSKMGPKKIKCRISYLCRQLGTIIPSQEILSIFDRLDFNPKILKDEKAFELEIPSYRNDVHSEIDCVEEVARFYGFDRIELDTPKMISSIQKDAPLYLFEKKLHRIALRLGLQEILTCDLISPSQSKLQNPKGPILQALNSVSTDQSILRSSLLSNHLQVVKNNLNQNAKDLLFFEIGKTYTQSGDHFQEESMLAITLSGHLDPQHHETPSRPVDFFHLKGMFENLFLGATCSGIEIKKIDHPLFHPFRAASWIFEGRTIGSLGEIHPSVLREMQIKQRVFFGEVSVPSLEALSTPLQQAKTLSSFPSTERDWTLTCLQELEVGHLLGFIQNLNSRLLKEVKLVNIYESDKIGEGRKNVSLRFVYRNDKKTISFEATEVEHARILNLVLKKMKTMIIQPI